MPNETEKDFATGLSCPIPIRDYPTVLLAHGGGGKLTHQLIEKIFAPTFKNSFLDARHDGAVINLAAHARRLVQDERRSTAPRLAFTTDSYVVRPLFFPGGDIGSLAVNGTVNDLAMCGARPLYLSAGFILEEGLPMETLWRAVQSMQKAAAAANVQLVTGDTKVVDRGKGDGIFINTAGIGILEHALDIAPTSVQRGDRILLSGDIGRHGIAIMAQRETLAFETTIESDCAPVADLVLALLGAGIEIHCLRDLTRGGLASALVEIAETATASIEIDEAAIAVREEVQGACEMLGFDPLYVANEGRFIAFVAQKDAGRALEILHAHSLGVDAALIGSVVDRDAAPMAGLVMMKSKIGATRVIDLLSGEQLPRIC